jgi:hypothetical protein
MAFLEDKRLIVAGSRLIVEDIVRRGKEAGLIEIRTVDGDMQMRLTEKGRDTAEWDKLGISLAALKP